MNQPVFFPIAHARVEGGEEGKETSPFFPDRACARGRGRGREGKNGMAKLARFLKSLGMFGGISHI